MCQAQSHAPAGAAAQSGNARHQKVNASQPAYMMTTNIHVGASRRAATRPARRHPSPTQPSKSFHGLAYYGGKTSVLACSVCAETAALQH
jgi:hypothetical protein